MIDIILPEDDETEPSAGKSKLQVEEEVEEERRVEAKTDVVRCELRSGFWGAAVPGGTFILIFRVESAHAVLSILSSSR